MVEHDGVEFARDPEIVGGGERPLAQIVEREPRRALAARGTRTTRPFTIEVERARLLAAGEPPPGLVERCLGRGSAGTCQTGTPASFSSRKSVRAASRTTSMCCSSSAMNGRKSARLSPSL